MERTATREQFSGATLYVAFDLGEQSWKLAMTVGLGQKPRVRTMRAGDLGIWGAWCKSWTVAGSGLAWLRTAGW